MDEAGWICEHFYDSFCGQIINRNVVRQELWVEHLQNPVLALMETRRRSRGKSGKKLILCRKEEAAT